MTWGNSDVPRLQYKATVFSHITKNASLTLCQKVLNTCKYIVNQITRPVYWTTYCIVLIFSMDHFGKLGVNLTLESICMKGECAFKKHKHTHTCIYIYVHRYIYVCIYKFKHKFNINLTPSSHKHPFLSTTKHLGKIRLHMAFTLFVNSPKKFFEQTKI